MDNLVALKLNEIAFAQLCSMIGCLKLEIKGLKHSRGSVYARVKRIYNLTGSKQRVLEQLEAKKEQMLKEAGVV